ncbi:MAG: hypothetical protein AB3N15_16945 [Paracoccaceae bacterium]
MTRSEGHEKDDLRAIYDRVWNDAEFVARLQIDPTSALCEYLDHLPEDVSLKVV